MDKSNGVWTRMRIIPFNVVFRDTDRQNPHLIDELIEEMPGVLNWSFMGRVKLYERTSQSHGKKTFPQCSEGAELLSKMREDSDHEQAFLRETTEANPNSKISSQRLFDEYKEWAAESGYRAVAIGKFNDAVKREYPNATFSRRNDEHKRKLTFIQGVSLLPLS